MPCGAFSIALGCGRSAIAVAGSVRAQTSELLSRGSAPVTCDRGSFSRPLRARRSAPRPGASRRFVRFGCRSSPRAGVGFPSKTRKIGMQLYSSSLTAPHARTARDSHTEIATSAQSKLHCAVYLVSTNSIHSKSRHQSAPFLKASPSESTHPKVRPRRWGQHNKEQQPIAL